MADSRTRSKENRQRGTVFAAEEILMDSIIYIVGVVVIVMVVAGFRKVLASWSIWVVVVGSSEGKERLVICG